MSEVVEIRITDAWKRLIYYCQNKIPHGVVEFRIVNGSPTELLKAEPKVRFDKSDTIPPFKNNEL